MPQRRQIKQQPNLAMGIDFALEGIADDRIRSPLDECSDTTMTDGFTEKNRISRREIEEPTRALPISTKGLSNLDRVEEDGLEILGRGVKELVCAVQSLRHLGVENHLPLPKVVVVGDQSTGKSSLIEAISEIKVPRSAGTCTRCPFEINLTEEASEWTCKIFLHKKYFYQGNSKTKAPGKNGLKSEGATRARPLGPWAEQDAEDLPFAHIRSKEELLDVLERAQLATLNPGSSFESYKPGTPLLSRTHQVKFSPNIIRLDIAGPGLPNLSFYDLPGVINVSEVPDEAYLVDLVRNLVKQYIRAPDCINVLALTMTHDVANSSAFGLIHEMKAEPRTVGCLTKPDRIANDDALDQWVQILRGEAFQLGFGYHVIKNNQNPDVDHATARREEAAFFSNNAPWTTELSAYNDRFGILELQTALSQRLTAQIRTNLPTIHEQIRSKAELVRQQLSQLPEPQSNNLALTVMGELITFDGNIKKHFEGGMADFPFQKEWDAIAQNFQRNLAETYPVLVFSSNTAGRTLQPFRAPTGTPNSAARNTSPIPIDSGDDDDDSDKLQNTPSKPDPRLNSFGKRPAPSPFKSLSPKLLKTTSGVDGIVPQRNGAKRFYLAEVKNIFLDTYIGGIKKINPKAIEHMIAISMDHWEVQLQLFMDKTKVLCEETVFRQIQNVYSKHSQTKYYDTIMRICEAFLEHACTDQQNLVKRILSWERNRPKTCNDKAMESAEVEALAVLHGKSRAIRAEAYISEQERKSGKVSSGQARLEKTDRVTDAQLSPERYSQEIDAMSTVKAYYECAHYRFVDTVVSSVRGELFERCSRDITQEMRGVFRLTEAGVEERLALLLAADPRQEQRRKQLIKDLDTINQAQERLNELTDVE